MIDNTQDSIDSRNIINWIEELEQDEGRDEEDTAELKTLQDLAEQCRDSTPEFENGEVLIRDSYFTEYAQDLAGEAGRIPQAGSDPWPLYCIDWEYAARELQMDYTPVEFDGVTYWVRSG